MTIQINFVKEKGVANIYGQSMLMHCNHYNRSLQQFIEDPSFIESESIFLKSAAETVYLQFCECFKQNPDLSFKEKCDLAAEIFKFVGFGILDFSRLTEKGGTVVGKSSHFGEALKLNFGKRTKPGEYFDRGFVAGVLLALKDSLDESLRDGFSITQTKSISLGDDICEFEINSGKLDSWLEELETKELPSFGEIPSRTLGENIDEDTIVNALSGMEIAGNDDGLIPAFGVYLTRMYADYYNKISFRFEHALKEAQGSVDLATQLLIEAGHICGFNTMGGIMESAEWDGLIKPMIQTREDWMHGIIACINSIGWGIWRVAELVPKEKLVVRIYEPYESIGHLKWFGKSDHTIDYLATGVATALMNHLYYGDITQKPALDKDYYYKLFQTEGGFGGEQTKCVAMGDGYSEIIVTPK